MGMDQGAQVAKKGFKGRMIKKEKKFDRGSCYSLERKEKK